MFSRRKSSSPSVSPSPGASSSCDRAHSPGISLTTPSPEPSGSSSKHLPPPALDYNPISDYFHFGKLIASAGPELAWRIYDANKKDDGQVRHDPFHTFFSLLPVYFRCFSSFFFSFLSFVFSLPFSLPWYLILYPWLFWYLDSFLSSQSSILRYFRVNQNRWRKNSSKSSLVTSV